MARSISEIYNAMIAEKNLQASLNALQPAIDNSQMLLNDLTSTSRVARWRLFIWIVAFGSWLHESLWDQTKIEIEQIAANAVAGTGKWYAAQCLKFQLGYPLVYLNDRFQYSIIDPNAQIIARSAVVDRNGQVLIKVAKESAGILQPLNSTELAALSSYMNQIKYAGTATVIVSQSPDLLKVIMTVYYNPQVLDSAGNLLNTTTKPVEDSINAYLKSLPFNGTLHLARLEDEVQKAQGVSDDVELTFASAKVGIGPHAAINISYTSEAGYMIIDPSFPLSTTITYLPDPNV